MRRIIGIAVCLIAALLPVLSPVAAQGIVREGLTLESRILGHTVRYTVYLPADYATSSRYYPVVYLLHGYTDNDMGWMQFGEAHLIVDDAIASRELPPMILIMPDAGVSWYINNHDGSVRYEDFFFEEFMPQIEKRYRIRAEKRYRGVAGLSMGGFGALVYAMKHPDVFSACAPLSAAIYTDTQVAAWPQARWDHVAAVLYGPGLKGEARLTAHLRANSPMHLVAHGDVDAMKQVRYWLDCGDDDRLSSANALFHVQLKERGVPHEFRMRDGGHHWPYWRSGLKAALQFIGEGFHQF